MKKKFCIKGHDISVVGRYSDGHCKECQKEYRQVNKEKILEWNRNNAEEIKEYHRKRYIENKEEILEHQHKYNEENREHINERSKVYYENHRDAVLERTIDYGNLHKEQRRKTAKEWAKENPEKRKLAKLQADEERALRVPKFGQRGIKTFYKNKPDWAQGDHKIPLLGDTVSGLHVSWNLQYLTPEENNFKSNKFDGTLENNSWKKDFKEP